MALVDGAQGGAACAPAWYALHVRSQCEYKVRDALSREHAAEPFLPLYLERARWSDRTKTVERVLFPGYVFGHFDIEARRKVVAIPGVVRILGFGTELVPVADSDIDQVRRVVDSGLAVEPMALVTAGSRVRVADGILTGLEGVVIRLKGSWRVVVSVPMLGRSVATELDTDQLEPLPAPAPRLRAA